MTKIFETHCHLDYLKAFPIEEILSLCREANIEKILTISVEPDNLDTVMELSKKYSEVFFTQGVHPHDAIKMTEDALKKIQERCSEEKMLAVGEIGLDFHYNHSPKDVQIAVFEQQLELAIKEKKPVVIHSREADEDMLRILKNYAPKLDRKGVIHSFSSGLELARKALELGFYLGFNGIITFKNAKEVRQAVELTPLDKILVETDSPFLSPVPKRGKENNPSNLPYIIEKIAEIKNIPAETVTQTTYDNALRLFFN